MRCFSILFCLFMLGVQTVAQSSVASTSYEKRRKLAKKTKKQTKREKQTVQTPNTSVQASVQQASVNTQTEPCLLFFEVHHNEDDDDFKWRCKMKGLDATNAGAMVGGEHAYVDIQGIDSVLAAMPDIVSGETLLLAQGAAIEDHLLVITPENELKFDTYRHSAESERRRKLSTSTGNKNVLVVRVSTADSQPTASAAEMSDSIFGTNGDPVNLKTQYEGCSAGRITITPATGAGVGCTDNRNFKGFYKFPNGEYAGCDWFRYSPDPNACRKFGYRTDLAGGGDRGNTACCACGGGSTSSFNNNVVNGVFEIYVPVRASSLVSSQLAEAALNSLEAQFRTSNLEDQFDYVMLCLPPGTLDGYWLAYASLPGYVSVYNDQAILFPSFQMHEVGHNLGLTHAADVTDIKMEYGDRTGMMGVSYLYVDDGPRKARMCFNPAKSYVLGWYNDRNAVVNVAAGARFCGRLVGVANYPTITGNEKVVLKIPSGGVDFYVGYNHAVGYHEGTNEAVNKVTVVSQGLSFGAWSFLEARLSAGEKAIIPNFLGSGQDLTIQVSSIDTSARGYAEVQVYRGSAGC